MTNSVFNRGDLIDGCYKVDFFLYQDELTETYRVRSSDNELKFFKLIKADYISAIEQTELTEALKGLSQSEQSHILKPSQLQTVSVAGIEHYYFVYDFVAGETLKQRLDRDIVIDAYKACKLIKSCFEILSDFDSAESLVLTPENIFIEGVQNSVSTKLKTHHRI